MLQKHSQGFICEQKLSVSLNIARERSALKIESDGSEEYFMVSPWFKIT
jgi:hypothetical protein